jgi:hypothetical protein
MQKLCERAGVLQGMTLSAGGGLYRRSRVVLSISMEVAPEHGRSTYGEPGEGLTPNDIYTEVHARDLVARARRAGEIAVRFFRELNVPTD